MCVLCTGCFCVVVVVVVGIWYNVYLLCGYFCLSVLSNEWVRLVTFNPLCTQAGCLK